MDEKKKEAAPTPKLNRAQRRAFQKQLKELKGKPKATLTETLNGMTKEQQIEFYAKLYKAVVDKRAALQKEEAENGIDETEGQRNLSS